MTANLPDNVTATTTYTVDQRDEVTEIRIESDIAEGNVWLRQDDDTVLVRVDAIPGLIAALQAAAGVSGVTPYVIDCDGDRWERLPDSTYALVRRPDVVRSLSLIREEFSPFREEYTP